MTNNHPTPQPHPDREEIARIIDPYAFHPSATLNPNIHVQSVVLAKADSILAKIGSPSVPDERGLLPCPFCGHRPLSAAENAGLWWISCTHCEADISHGVKDHAIAQWNTRASQSPSVPEGWKLLPEVATQAMIDAAWGCANAEDYYGIHGMWRAMISSAPEPPVGDGWTTWTKLGDRLPEIARPILLARWDAEGFWRVRDAMLLIRHEGVTPQPSDMDSGLPTDWWFEAVYGGGDMRLGTPDLMWSPMPAPPSAAEGK